MNNKSAVLTILAALFKNKFRFGDGESRQKQIARFAIMGIFAAVIFAVMIVLICYIGKSMAISGLAAFFYMIMLLAAAVIVLIFGLVFLISTLYLSKDTDFYLMLPVKQSTVFTAKLLFVYICEAAISIVFLLPATITFGIVIGVTAWYYYVITIAMLAIIPALPLAAAVILAIPVMFVAGKFKNRSIVPLIFYVILICGYLGVYLYSVFSLNGFASDEITEAQIAAIADTIKVMQYVFYPYFLLSAAVFGLTTFGLNAALSIVVDLLIFIGISAALITLLMILGKVMYAQSVKANNQTDNSNVKRGEFKTSGYMRAMIKREFKSALRSTQVTMQCFIGFFMIVIIAVISSFTYLKSPYNQVDGSSDNLMQFVMAAAMIAFIMPITANAALSSYSREGKAVSSLKILPLTGKQILLSKIAAWEIFAVPSALIAAIIPNAFSFEVSRFFISTIGLTLLCAVSVAFGVLWDLVMPKLKWTDPMQAVKHNTRLTLGNFIMLGSGAVFFVASLLMIIYGCSESVMSAVVWSLIYFDAAIFAVVDILLYRKTEKYYNRLEI